MLRSITAAVAALSLLTPAAHAAGPWSDPAPIPGAVDSFPLLTFASFGGGAVVWPNVTDDPAGQTSGAPVSATAVGTARTLVDGMTVTAAAAYSSDRLAVAGSTVEHGVGRAVVALGPLGGPLSARRLPGASSVRAIAANPRGDIAAVTATCGRTCSTQSLALVVRQAGASGFRRVARLARPGQQVRTATVAVNPRGDVLAAWEKRHHVYGRIRTAGGRLSQVERIGDGVQTTISAVLSPERRAVVAWGSQRVSEGDTSTPFLARAAVRRPTARRFHTARVVGRVNRTGTGRFVAAPGIEASLTGVRTTVAFTTTGSDGRYAVATRDLDAVGRPGPAQQLSPAGVDAVLGGVVTGRTGEQVAFFITGRAGSDPTGPTGLHASSRAASAAAFGAPEMIAAHEFIDRLSAQIDPASNRPFVTWRAAGAPIQIASREPVG